MTRQCAYGVLKQKSVRLKDLGLIVHSSLTWTLQAEFRCGKAVKAFHLIRHIIWVSADSYTRLSLYKGYIVPILSHGAILWKSSKNDLKIIESVQIKTSKWILRYCPIGYKERLQKLKLLPLSLYHELHVLLTFISIVNDKFRLDWKSKVEIVKIDKRRSSVQYKCKEMKFKSYKQEGDFWLRATTLANLFGRFFGVDVAKVRNFKTKLLTAYLSYFNRSFNEMDMCS